MSYTWHRVDELYISNLHYEAHIYGRLFLKNAALDMDAIAEIQINSTYFLLKKQTNQ